MASGSGKEVGGGKPGTGSSAARARWAWQLDVSQTKDPEAFLKGRSGSPLANDPASLQERFHDDPKAALEWVTKADDPAFVPTLADLLRDEAITHFYMAEALEQITDEPDRSRAIEIKRIDAAHVESFPPRAVISAAEDDKIRELVEKGSAESLLEAFRINRARASELIAEAAKIDSILRENVAWMLAFLLREQASVQLFMALALARIAEQPQQKSRAIEILLDEAAQLTDRETLCPALLSLKSFEPLAVIPSLSYFQHPCVQYAAGTCL